MKPGFILMALFAMPLLLPAHAAISSPMTDNTKTVAESKPLFPATGPNSFINVHATHSEIDSLEVSADGTVTYLVADVMPSYPGGPQALMAYLSSNIKYPAVLQKECANGRSIIRFVIDADGNIVDIKSAKPMTTSHARCEQLAKQLGKEQLLEEATQQEKQDVIQYIFDKEAIRVISQMPQWIPGKQGGKAVRFRMNIPVTFKWKKTK